MYLAGQFVNHDNQPIEILYFFCDSSSIFHMIHSID